MRVIITGGGTGGHIYPALAIANSILKKYPQSEVLYIGTYKGLEARIVPQANINFQAIEVEGFQRKISLNSLKTGAKAFNGVWQALKIIKKFSPQVVIGTGGYVCGPVVLAAKLLKLPTIIHEQNALPGVTNRLLAKFADKIMITFPQSAGYFNNQGKVVLTGLPIRQEILEITRDQGYSYLNLDKQKKTLLVTGGSRGAQKINQAMVEAYHKLLNTKNLQVIHITGQQDYTNVVAALRKSGINLEKYGNIILKPYLDRMEYALAITDLYVARAGATFLAEVTAKGIAGILVPYPYAAENHQEFNAQALVQQGAGRMILDKDLNGRLLAEALIDYLQNEEKLVNMGKNSKKAGNTNSMAKIMRVIEEIVDL